jgi:hypothetical protein
MKHLRGGWVWFLALLLGGLSLGAAAGARAQDDSRITMLVEAGFSSFVKETAWTPIRISLVNAGDAFDGEVTVTNTRLAVSEVYSQRVTLGRNTGRKLTLYVPGNSNAFDVRLMQGDVRIASAAPVLRQLTTIDRLTVTVSDPPDALNFLGDVRVAYGGSTAVAPMRLTDLPDRVAALDAVDVMVFNAVDSSALSANQRAAIRAWVLAGGHLILSGGPGAQLTLGGFDDLAPARIGGALIGSSIAPLADLIAPESVESAAEALTQTVPMVSLASLRPGTKVLATSSETPLIARSVYGRGLVDQLAFDPSLAPMRDWPGNAQFFETLFGSRINMTAAAGQIEDIELVAQTAGALPAAAMPSALVILAFFTLYVLAIGPLNFLVLRRLRRTNLAWITIPALVLGFTAFGLLTGFRARGNNAQLHRLTVLLSDAGSADARAYSIIGAYSPRTARLALETGRALVNNIAAPRDGEKAETDTLFVAGEPGTLSGLEMDGSAVRTLLTNDLAMPGKRIDATAVYVPASGPNAPARLDATIRNLSQENLEACTLVVGKDYQAIGEIAAGQSVKASALMHLGHPQSAMNLRGAEILRAVYYRGRYYGITNRSNPESAPPQAGSDYPFDLNGAPAVNALVNWQVFDRNDLLQEARYGLVAGVLGLEYVSPGATLGCWVRTPVSAISTEGAQYTDQTLLLWRLPVQSYLADRAQTLPPDIFQWDIADSSASVSFQSAGLVMQPGDHIISLRPWFETRLTRISDPVISLDMTLAASDIIDVNTTAAVDIFDWDKREFVQVAASIETLSTATEISGPYISASGDMRLRVRVRDEEVTLSKISPRITLR